MSDLAAQTSMSTSGITRVVDRLQRAGSVRREPAPEDRRSSYAVLTDTGLEQPPQTCRQPSRRSNGG